MPVKKYKREQIVSLPPQIEVAVASGKATAQACRDNGITEQTYYRWRKEYGGLKLDQAKRLKELEKENLKLKRLVAVSLRRRENARESTISGAARDPTLPCPPKSVLPRQPFGPSLLTKS